MIRVTKYRAELASADDHAEVHRQLWLAGAYRRALVWMTNGERAAERALFLQNPKIVEAEAQLRDPECPDRATVIVRLRELRSAQVKTDDHRAARSEIYDRRSAMSKALRSAIVARGLHWGTYLLVEDAHARAVREAHLWEDLHVKGAWDQIGVVVPAAQPILGADLFGGTDSRIRIAARPLALHRDRGDLYGRLVEDAVNLGGATRPRAWRLCQLRVGSGETNRVPRWANCYIRTEAKSGSASRNREEIRRVPTDARIVGVRLVRTDAVHQAVRGTTGFQMMARERWEIHVIHHDVESRTSPTGDGVVGVDIGWRRVDGGIRIGTAALHTGEFRELVIPDRVLADRDRADGIQSVRDMYMNHARTLIMGLRDDHPWLNDVTPAIHMWRKIGRFIRVVNLICTRHTARPEDGLGWVALTLAAWLGKDRHLREYEAGLRRSLRLAIRGRQREWTAAILHGHATVGIEDATLNVAKMRQRGAVDEDTRRAAVAHTATAPAELRRLIAQMAGSRGIRVIACTPGYASCTCGATVTAGAKDTLTCRACSAINDPNYASAREIRRASIAVLAAPAQLLAPEKSKTSKPKRRLSNRRRVKPDGPLAATDVTTGGAGII